MQKTNSELVGEARESYWGSNCAIARNSRPRGDTYDALAKTRDLLSSAEANQPCPACKHDIGLLRDFVQEKMLVLGTERTLANSDAAKKLESVDSINEITRFAILITRVLGPLTRIVAVNAPQIYEKVLHDDMEPNRKVREDLLEARRLIATQSEDPDCRRVLGVVDMFARATDFKLSIDPALFYLYDKTIRIGYKTHVWALTTRTIAMLRRENGAGTGD
jgi:hypothetical protein